jgi:hypothetical protein
VLGEDGPALACVGCRGPALACVAVVRCGGGGGLYNISIVNTWCRVK